MLFWLILYLLVGVALFALMLPPLGKHLCVSDGTVLALILAICWLPLLASFAFAWLCDWVIAIYRRHHR